MFGKDCAWENVNSGTDKSGYDIPVSLTFLFDIRWLETSLKQQQGSDILAKAAHSF